MSVAALAAPFILSTTGIGNVSVVHCMVLVFAALVRWNLCPHRRCSDFRPALLHVSPACRDPFHGEPASRRSTSGPYLLSSHLRPRRAGSRGPASVVVSHGHAARPTVRLPVPMRRVCLRSAGVELFALDWCPSGHSRLLSRRILSHGVRPIPLYQCAAGSCRLVSIRPLSIDFRSVISTCCGPVPLGWFPPRCTSRGVAGYPDPAGRAYSNARAGV